MTTGLDCACAKHPALFEEYFQLGQEETSSPFLTPTSRRWGENLNLKIALVAAGFLIISFALSFFPQWVPLSSIFLLIVYFLVGIPSLIKSLEELASFEINIQILMTLAAFSSILIGSGMEGGLLLVLFAVSGAMEEYVTNKAKGDISALHKLAPTKASTIEPNGTLVERSIREIRVGTLILVKSGQIVPLDGIVTEGVSSVNLVHITGENLPITKQIGDDVPAGARNLEGSLVVKVTRTSSDSTLTRIIQLVTKAQEEKPLLQRWFDKLSRSYALAIIGFSLLFAMTLPFFIAVPFLGVEGSIYRALAFLIAASPCALIIAIPIAYFSAVGVCARQGILLKGGLTLDALAQCRMIAFDKTGTLTKGELKLEAIEAISTASQKETDEALQIAYSIERNAVHPIAKAMVAYGQDRNLQIVPIKNFQAIPGYGLQAIIQSDKGEKEVYIGKPEYVLPKLTSETAKTLKTYIASTENRGELLAVLLTGQSLFVLRFRDMLRPRIHETLEELRNADLRLVMLTGDNLQSAKAIADELKITEYHANLRPEDKLQLVSQMSVKEPFAMIGDGINDAPALARANVGIAMGKLGSTAAIDASDIVLLRDNIELIPWLLRKSYQTQRIVKQNLILATLAIFVASLPALAGIVPLWLAVIMHEGGTVLVGINGLRLLRK